MNRSELVIAGGGLTAARAIKAYREADGDGAITLVAEEATLPYHRPALSKRYLRGDTNETPHVEDEAFYREHDVEVLLETQAVAVEPGVRRLRLDNGIRLPYDKLLVATGRRRAAFESREPTSQASSRYARSSTRQRSARRRALPSVPSSSAAASSAWRRPRLCATSAST